MDEISNCGENEILEKKSFGDVVLDEKDALKKINIKGLDEEDIEKYNNKIKISRGFEDENTIKFYDSSEEKDTLNCLMGYGGESNLGRFINSLKNIKMPTEHTKILKTFKDENLFFVTDKIDELKKNYLLKVIEIINKTEKKKIIDIINPLNLTVIEKYQNKKIILYIYLEITKSNNIFYLDSFLNENILQLKEKDIWNIIIKLIIEINFIINKNIEINNLNQSHIFIDDNNNVKINIIDLAISKNNDKDNYNENKDEEISINSSIKEDNINNINNISISTKKIFDGIGKMKNKKKKFILYLSIILLKIALFASTKDIKLIKSISDNIEFNNSQIQKYIDLIKDESLKNFLSKILCNKDTIIDLEEIILEKNFLKKIIELNLLEQLTNSEKNLV